MEMRDIYLSLILESFCMTSPVMWRYESHCTTLQLHASSFDVYSVPLFESFKSTLSHFFCGFHAKTRALFFF